MYSKFEVGIEIDACYLEALAPFCICMSLRANSKFDGDNQVQFLAIDIWRPVEFWIESKSFRGNRLQ